MNFSIGCDHAGPAYKNLIIEHLKERGFSVKNCGTDLLESVDYPDFAHAVANDIADKSSELGILICGSANGVAMTANKHPEVRAGIAWLPEVASLARTHNDANVICIPARFVNEKEAIMIVDSFVDSKFEGGRHARRVGKIACGIMAMMLAISTSFGQTAEKYANMLDSTKLKGHLSIIASDGFEGRETGTRGAELTAAYLESYYINLGFKPYDGDKYVQQVPMINSQINGGEINISGQKLNIVDDFLCYPGIRVHQMDSIDMVFAGYGIIDGSTNNYEGLDVKGKAVVILSGDYREEGELSEEFSKSQKREIADSLGAKALIILMDNGDYNTFRGRMKYYMMRKSTVLNRDKDGTGSSMPTFFLSENSADSWVSSMKGVKTIAQIRKKAIKKQECITGELESEWSYKLGIFRQEFFASNVLAYLPGTDSLLKDEVVIITSHYDHIGIIDGEINNGADDDGSGTVTVMELARLFMEASKDGFGPRRSVLFMNVVGEEKGLLGSEWYSDHPIYPLEKTVANLNIDMIGRVDEAHEDDENYIYLIGADKLSTELHAISEKANSTYTNLALDYTFNAPDDPNRFYYRSDHYNFAKHNIPVIFYFSGVHEDYHAPGDDVEKIMFTKTAKIGRLVFHTAWELLNRDEKIVVDVVNDFPE
ncbi:MAG: hypothetical protein COA49_02855 [Bacteroidetes bacterium]|nr:MAG: hypothetical protein COA49_02855 [Bacteroidota bacterium]